MHYLVIALGGALGAMSRAFLSSYFTKILGTSFPFATLAVNFLGSFLMGVCAVIILDHFKMTGYWRELIMVGFLGALTTFSTFSLEGLNLLHSGQWAAAMTYFVASVVGCVFACFVGFYLAKLFV
ncbi:fluoride efflux transporter CrcB [Pseudomonas sp. HK3]|jgi:CrcB protein